MSISVSQSLRLAGGVGGRRTPSNSKPCVIKPYYCSLFFLFVVVASHMLFSSCSSSLFPYPPHCITTTTTKKFRPNWSSNFQTLRQWTSHSKLHILPLCRHKHHNKSVVGNDRNDALAKNDFLQQKKKKKKKKLQFFFLKFKKKKNRTPDRQTDVAVKKQKKKCSEMLMKRTTLCSPATNWC
jgi:hypothetical protein